MDWKTVYHKTKMSLIKDTIIFGAFMITLTLLIAQRRLILECYKREEEYEKEFRRLCQICQKQTENDTTKQNIEITCLECETIISGQLYDANNGMCTSCSSLARQRREEEFFAPGTKVIGKYQGRIIYYSL